MKCNVNIVIEGLEVTVGEKKVALGKLEIHTDVESSSEEFLRQLDTVRETLMSALSQGKDTPDGVN